MRDLLAEVWRVFRRQRAAAGGFLALAVIVVASPSIVALSRIDPEVISADVLGRPSLAHVMGTDYLGRDILDHVIMRAADGLLIVPTFFLVLAVAFIFGGRLTFVIVMLGLTTWPQIARIVRAEVLALKEEAFVQSARALGAGDVRLMFREILPNTLPPVVAMIALLGSSAILAEASLSFLGVGDPNVVSLGQMLTSGLEYVTNAWWVPGFPGAAIFVLVLLLNVLGDGLNVALNPRLRRGGV
jgi:peptide/nickel transport system permease protein